MEQTLEALVELAKAGDKRALEAVLGRIQDRVYGLALRMLWHPADTQDAITCARDSQQGAHPSEHLALVLFAHILGALGLFVVISFQWISIIRLVLGPLVVPWHPQGE